MKYYLTCGECGREPIFAIRRGDRVVHRCGQGHQTTELDERWLEKVVAVWDGIPLAVPMSMGMRRYQVRRQDFLVTKQNPMMKLRAIVRLKGYKDGCGPRS